MSLAKITGWWQIINSMLLVSAWFKTALVISKHIKILLTLFFALTCHPIKSHEQALVSGNLVSIVVMIVLMVNILTLNLYKIL